MMELDEENEADSRLEDDDHMMVVITMVKDDMLMLMEKEDDGRVSQEDSITTVMMEEVGGLEMVKCPVHKPLLGPDLKYLRLAHRHRTSWAKLCHCQAQLKLGHSKTAVDLLCCARFC